MLIRTGSVLILALLGLTGPAPAAQADRGACPASESGFVLWDVSTAPYRADNFVDAAGNGNGLVCARELPTSFVEDGVEYPIQNFIDDRL